MRLLAEISTGELIDKLTILEIKLDRIDDPAKRANVAREYSILSNVLPVEIDTDETIKHLRGELKGVNAELWRIEDDIRAEERSGRFGVEFIALARAVYQINDKRAALKREINMRTQSAIVEEKSYG